jgi:hypothetical protein
MWMPSILKPFQRDFFYWKGELSGEVCLDPIHFAFLDHPTLKCPPKYLRLNTRFIKEFGNKTTYTIWCVEIKLDIQARFPYSPPHKKEVLIN